MDCRCDLKTFWTVNGPDRKVQSVLVQTIPYDALSITLDRTIRHYK
jgi:hypothetical protein